MVQKHKVYKDYKRNLTNLNGLNLSKSHIRTLNRKKEAKIQIHTFSSSTLRNLCKMYSNFCFFIRMVRPTGSWNGTVKSTTLSLSDITEIGPTAMSAL